MKEYGVLTSPPSRLRVSLQRLLNFGPESMEPAILGLRSLYYKRVDR